MPENVEHSTLTLLYIPASIDVIQGYVLFMYVFTHVLKHEFASIDCRTFPPMPCLISPRQQAKEADSSQQQLVAMKAEPRNVGAFNCGLKGSEG